MIGLRCVIVKWKTSIANACRVEAGFDWLAAQHAISSEGVFVKIGLDVFWADVMEGVYDPVPRYAIFLADLWGFLVVIRDGDGMKAGAGTDMFTYECIGTMLSNAMNAGELIH